MNNDSFIKFELERLEQLARERPELEPLSRLSEELLRVLFTASTASRDPSATDAGQLELGFRDFEADFADGVPLFSTANMRPDAENLKKRWCDVCGVLERHGENEASRLCDAVSNGTVNPAKQLEHVLAGDTQLFFNMLKQLNLSDTLGFTILRFASLPRLAVVSREYETRWQENSWKHGYCPACGSEPLLAEFRGLEQLRWLRCGLCAAGWQVDRLYCPFCENRDHQQLEDRYVTPDQTRYRLSVCRKCNRSLPGLTTLEALTAAGILVAEMETLHLRFAQGGL